jgi:hypothetical protein
MGVEASVRKLSELPSKVERMIAKGLVEAVFTCINNEGVGPVGSIRSDELARQLSLVTAMPLFGSTADSVARTPGAPPPVLPYTRSDGSMALNFSMAEGSRKGLTSGERVVL